MKPVKRLEIVVDTAQLDHVLGIVDGAGVSGYTVIRDVGGRGDRGLRQGTRGSDTAQNSYVICACDWLEAQNILEALRPLLQEVGGVCLVSDSVWLVHEQHPI